MKKTQITIEEDGTIEVEGTVDALFICLTAIIKYGKINETWLEKADIKEDLEKLIEMVWKEN